MFYLLIVFSLLLLLLFKRTANNSNLSFSNNSFSDKNDYLVIIQNAIKMNKEIKIGYKSSYLHSGEKTERIIIPIELKKGKDIVNNELIKNSDFCKDVIYLRAYCKLRREERNFRLDRILYLKVLEN